jgi:tripeptide aminopeptidase
MARELAQELAQLGLDDIVIDEFATVTAVKKGNVPGAPRIGFITHIDTVDVGLSPDIHPQILTFTGEDLCLNKEKDIWLRVKSTRKFCLIRMKRLFSAMEPAY